MICILMFIVLAAVMYPIHGACMYGDPWTWIFEDAAQPEDAA